MEKPSRGGEKRTAVWASHPEERGSDDVVAPPVCDHRVVPHRWVVCDRCNPSGSAADAGHEAAAWVRGSARAAEDGVVDVPQALHGAPGAPPITAQRVARFDHYRARNCLPPQKLHERYSRYMVEINYHPQSGWFEDAPLKGGAVAGGPLRGHC